MNKHPKTLRRENYCVRCKFRTYAGKIGGQKVFTCNRLIYDGDLYNNDLTADNSQPGIDGSCRYFEQK